MEQDSSSAAISAELEALTSKRASLKDRLKRRREAMGTILQEATKDMAAIKASSAAAAAAAPGAASSKGQQRAAATAAAEDQAKRLLLLSEVKKPKLDDTVAKETTSTTEAQQCKCRYTILTSNILMGTIHTFYRFRSTFAFVIGSTISSSKIISSTQNRV